MENKIENIEISEEKDSRGNPTIKVTVYSGIYSGSFSVPSGASTGINEAYELKDEDGGVKKAIFNLEEKIKPALLGKNVLNQKEIDDLLISIDNTKNKSNLGGNTMIGVSIACLKLASKIKKIELFEYLKTFFITNTNNDNIIHFYINLINGGKHAKNNLAFQEYHIVTMTFDLNESLNIGLEIQNLLESFITLNLGKDALIVGDEGGFAPTFSNIREPLFILSKIIKENNLEGKVRLAIDVASSSFFKEGFYLVDNKKINKEELFSIYDSLIKEFSLISIEDPFFEEDFESFAFLKEKYKDLIVIGDDLTVTNKNLLEKAIKSKSINAIIIKPNQIGTFSEMVETINLSIENNIKLIISHRSGETLDDFIADLAFSLNAFGFKSGSPRKIERMVKYKRLIDISKKI